MPIRYRVDLGTAGWAIVPVIVGEEITNLEGSKFSSATSVRTETLTSPSTFLSRCSNAALIISGVMPTRRRSSAVASGRGIVAENNKKSVRE